MLLETRKFYQIKTILIYSLDKIFKICLTTFRLNIEIGVVLFFYLI